jgi:hypothetical protein
VKRTLPESTTTLGRRQILKSADHGTEGHKLLVRDAHSPPPEEMIPGRASTFGHTVVQALVAIRRPM